MSAPCETVRDLAAGYVLGALEPAEERLVREHLATCAEDHREFAELGGVVPYLAELAPAVEPPAALKQRILAAAAADLRHRRLASPDEPAVQRTLPAEPTPFPTAAERQAREVRSSSRLAWVAAVAAVIAVVVMGGWNLSLQREADRARGDQRALSAVLDVAAQPGSQTAILIGEDGGGPSGLAAIARDGRVAIIMRGLPPTSGREVYEAWVIGATGTPRAIGGFTVGPSGDAGFTASGVEAEPGVTLALTREPAPGATAPSGPVVSSGVATAADS